MAYGTPCLVLSFTLMTVAAGVPVSSRPQETGMLPASCPPCSYPKDVPGRCIDITTYRHPDTGQICPRCVNKCQPELGQKARKHHSAISVIHNQAGPSVLENSQVQTNSVLKTTSESDDKKRQLESKVFLRNLNRKIRKRRSVSKRKSRKTSARKKTKKHSRKSKSDAPRAKLIGTKKKVKRSKTTARKTSTRKNTKKPSRNSKSDAPRAKPIATKKNVKRGKTTARKTSTRKNTKKPSRNSKSDAPRAKPIATKKKDKIGKTTARKTRPSLSQAKTARMSTPLLHSENAQVKLAHEKSSQTKVVTSLRDRATLLGVLTNAALSQSSAGGSYRQLVHSKSSRPHSIPPSVQPMTSQAHSREPGHSITLTLSQTKYQPRLSYTKDPVVRASKPPRVGSDTGYRDQRSGGRTLASRIGDDPGKVHRGFRRRTSVMISPFYDRNNLGNYKSVPLSIVHEVYSLIGDDRGDDTSNDISDEISPNGGNDGDDNSSDNNDRSSDSDYGSNSANHDDRNDENTSFDNSWRNGGYDNSDENQFHGNDGSDDIVYGSNKKSGYSRDDVSSDDNTYYNSRNHYNTPVYSTNRGDESNSDSSDDNTYYNSGNHYNTPVYSTNRGDESNSDSSDDNTYYNSGNHYNTPVYSTNRGDESTSDSSDDNDDENPNYPFHRLTNNDYVYTNSLSNRGWNSYNNDFGRRR